MAVTETKRPIWADTHSKRAVASASGSLNEASVLSVLLTALPSSLLAEALTNSAAVGSELASDFSAGETPSWFIALPTPVQTYLLGQGEATNATGLINSTAPLPPAPPSSQHSSSSSYRYIPATTITQQTTVPYSSSYVYSNPQQTAPTTNAPTPGTALTLFSSRVSVQSPSSSTSSATHSPTPTPSPGPPTGAIAGGVVGGVAGLALIGAGAAFLLRRRKRQQRVEPMREVAFDPPGGGYGYR